MLPVEILPVQETIVLRARGSELLILPVHVQKLKEMAKPRDFSQYFRAEALVNRPARKLFEAWLRKDNTLWPRLYQTVHKEMEATSSEDEKPAKKAAPAAKAKAKEADEPKAAKKPEVKAKEEKPAKEAKAAPKAKEKEKEPKKAEKEPKKAAAPKAKEKKEEKAKPAKAKAPAGKKKG